MFLCSVRMNNSFWMHKSRICNEGDKLQNCSTLAVLHLCLSLSFVAWPQKAKCGEGSPGQSAQVASRAKGQSPLCAHGLINQGRTHSQDQSSQCAGARRVLQAQGDKGGDGQPGTQELAGQRGRRARLPDRDAHQPIGQHAARKRLGSPRMLFFNHLCWTNMRWQVRQDACRRQPRSWPTTFELEVCWHHGISKCRPCQTTISRARRHKQLHLRI